MGQSREGIGITDLVQAAVGCEIEPARRQMGDVISVEVGEARVVASVAVEEGEGDRRGDGGCVNWTSLRQ